MSELSSINENDTSLDILCDDTMDIENVGVMKSSGKCKYQHTTVMERMINVFDFFFALQK